MVLHVSRCHAHMLEVHTRITFSDLQQLLLALIHNNIDHDQIGVRLLQVTSLAKAIMFTIIRWPWWPYLFIASLARAEAGVVFCDL